MRRVALLLIFLGSLAMSARAHAWDFSSRPDQTWTFTTFRLAYGYTEGTREGRTEGGNLVGVPYRQQNLDFDFEIEDYDARRGPEQRFPNFIGIALGMRYSLRAGGVVQSEYDQVEGVEAVDGPTGWAGPVRMALGAGTLAQIIRENDFVLATHFSFEFLLNRATWSEDVAFLLVPGLRMVWQPGPIRLQLGYDFAGLWIGQDRVEHRATAAFAFQLGSIGLGVRFDFLFGQERRQGSTFEDMTYRGGLELVL
jgi:hypothetical protein